MRFVRAYPIPLATIAAIIAGAIVGRGADGSEWRRIVWTTGLVICGAPVVLKTIAGLFRGRFAADVVAAMAVVTAFVLGQPFVGLVIVLMQSGGEALERLAEGRATDALRALQDAAPRIVHRLRDGIIEDLPAEAVAVDETILVRPGEVIPCDGVVIGGRSHVDTSRITGEPMPVAATIDSTVMSGTVNQESPLTIRVTAVAAESQYARIVHLVREAQASKTPLQRTADRYAAWFTPITVAVCIVAFAISNDWDRVLAVLAVATPCPLILATPVAVLGGMNRSARKHVLLRNGGALEAIGTVTAAIFDKTGTVTVGRPEVSLVIPSAPMTELALLAKAAAVERFSGHLLARTLVDEAVARGADVPEASGVSESPGRGAEGSVGGSHVMVGARSYIVERFPAVDEEIGRLEDADSAAALRAYVSVDGRLAGIVEYADRIRPGMREMMRRLSAIGVGKIMLLSGDRAKNAAAVASLVGIAHARGDLLPEDKVKAVRDLMESGERVLMLGDGTNDAPALSAATVGVALASQGRGIATEAADVILLADEPARIVDAILISRRTMRIARQSILVGLGLSSVGMVAAALGFIPPVAGALIQEGVDLAVILNALRASGAGGVKEMPVELPPEPDIRGPDPRPSFAQRTGHDRSNETMGVLK